MFLLVFNCCVIYVAEPECILNVWLNVVAGSGWCLTLVVCDQSAVEYGVWVKQSALNFNPTFDGVIDKVFFNGVGGFEIPVLLRGV